LDESFSDALGIAVKHHYYGNGGPIDWIFGRTHCSGHNGIRNLADPLDITMHKVQPDYYKGVNWDFLCSDIHINAGVPNKMFYLLSEGGTHATSGIYVPGLGIAGAMDILYDANMSYWPQNATLYQALFGMIAAANWNCGESYELVQVKRAWAAVGVGEALLVKINGAGYGAVTANSYYIPYAIKNTIASVNEVPAGYDYRYVYPPDDSVTLTAVPYGVANFDGWSGAGCAGTGTCTVSMSGIKYVTASFSSDSG
jgi:hypothetical protein